MGPWLAQPLIVPEFMFDEITSSQAEYPVTLSGYHAKVLECGTGWILMIKIPEPEKKEQWYRCASLLLIAHQLYNFSLIDRNNNLWFTCRYANSQESSAIMAQIELQLSVSVYLRSQLKRLLRKDATNPSLPSKENRLAHYFNGMV